MTIFRQRTDGVATAKASTTRRCARWILQRLAIEKMSVAAIAKALGLSWNTVNAVAAELARELMFGTPEHLDGVRYLGVDEHKWKHRRGQGEADFVTVIVDQTPVIDGTGPARLLDIVAGRSAAVLTNWLGARDVTFRSRVTVVSMDRSPATAPLPPMPCQLGKPALKRSGPRLPLDERGEWQQACATAVLAPSMRLWT